MPEPTRTITLSEADCLTLENWQWKEDDIFFRVREAVIAARPAPCVKLGEETYSQAHDGSWMHGSCWDGPASWRAMALNRIYELENPDPKEAP